MKKIITISIPALVLIFGIVKPVTAVTSTSSASPTQNLEDKYKLIVQENLSSAEAKLKEKVNLQTLVGYVGKITTISSGNLTLDSHGNLIQVTTTEKTVFLKNNSATKVTSLAIGDKVILIGTSVKDGIVQAKKISVIADEPVLVKTTVVVSEITSIDLKKKTITLVLDGINQTLALSKKSTVKLDEFKAGQNILAIIKEYQGKLSISRAKVL